MNDVANNSLASQSIESTVGDFVRSVIILKDWRFFVNDKPLSVSMISSNNAILPAILWSAEKMHQKLLGSSIGINFRSNGDATVGAEAVIGEMTGRSRATLLMFSLNSLVNSLENFPSEDNSIDVSPSDIRENILAGAKVPPQGSGGTVDHLIQAFFEDHERGLLPWTPDSKPKSPNMEWARSN